jgi:hypothetical protein
MVHKQTGELLIKTTESDIISYGYNSRLNMNLHLLTLNAFNNGIYGKIYSITPDVLDSEGNIIAEYDLPDVIEFDKSIIGECVIDNSVDSDFKFKKFMMFIDLDCLTVISGTLTNRRKLPKVALEYEAIDTTGKKTYTYESTIDELNSHVFCWDNVENTSFRITSLKFTLPEGFDPESETWRLILNNILVVFD